MGNHVKSMGDSSFPHFFGEYLTFDPASTLKGPLSPTGPHVFTWPFWLRHRLVDDVTLRGKFEKMELVYQCRGSHCFQWQLPLLSPISGDLSPPNPHFWSRYNFDQSQHSIWGLNECTHDVMSWVDWAYSHRTWLWTQVSVYWTFYQTNPNLLWTLNSKQLNTSNRTPWVTHKSVLPG